MKVKVTRWKTKPKMPVLDAWFLWFIGRMPGECFERIALKHGKEYRLYRPSLNGRDCPSSGLHKGIRAGIECRCDECPNFLDCFPDWQERKEQV